MRPSRILVQPSDARRGPKIRACQRARAVDERRPRTPRSAPRAAPSSLTAERAREERKLVSVLFVDLVGFTSQSDRADPEEVRDLLQGFHARAKQEIERFGGTVEKFIGDAVMAVFGAPVAHGDDAERAVRAGLRVVHAIGELNRERPDRPLQVRAAVNTGDAIVALGSRPEAGEAIALGDVVNTASRLQTSAPPGGLVVGEETYRATRNVIRYRELEPVDREGEAGPRGGVARVGATVPRPSGPRPRRRSSGGPGSWRCSTPSGSGPPPSSGPTSSRSSGRPASASPGWPPRSCRGSKRRVRDPSAVAASRTARPDIAPSWNRSTS